jgi:Uma2 family endonuclease
MSIAPTTARAFEPGTTGWTAADLDDHRIESHWEFGRYEIVEGVLTTMPPAYFDHGAAIAELVVLLRNHMREHRINGRLATELDIIISQTRVAKPDLALLTEKDQAEHHAAALRAGRRDPRRTRVLVPPTLVIESLSPEHERHDAQVKRRWYAEFRIPHYWLIDAYHHTFQCLTLGGEDYAIDVEGRDKDALRPSLFPGLVIPLRELWGTDDDAADDSAD